MLREQRLIVKKDLRTFSSKVFYATNRMHDKQLIFTLNSFFLKCDLSTFRTKLFPMKVVRLLKECDQSGLVLFLQHVIYKCQQFFS